MLSPSRMRAHLHTMAGGLPRPFWILWTGTLINRMGTFVVPFLAIYLTQVRGFSLAQAGLVAALYGAGAACAGALGGVLADRFGRRVTMVAALGLGGLSMMALGLASRIEVIAPGAFLVALITEMYRPAVQAAIADLVPAGDRVRAFGLLYWVINLGFAIGVTLGGLLATVSYSLLFIFDGATSLLYAVLVWRGVRETRPAVPAHAEGQPRLSTLAGFLAPFGDRTFVAFLALTFLTALVFMQGLTALPLDMTAHGVSRAAYGAVVGLNGLLIVVLQPFLGPPLARWNRSRTLAAGALLVGIGFGWNALAATALLYAIGVVLWTVGEMAVLPVANAMVADLAPVETRARYQGAYGVAFGLAACVAPALGSFVLQHLGSVALWTGCLAVGVLVAAGQMLLARRLAHLRESRLAEVVRG
jgi:MFS family permease